MHSGDNDEPLVEAAPEHLRSLADWLNSEDAFRGRVQPVRPAPEPGKLGGAIELLSVALGSGGTGAVLVRSISAWLTQRGSDVSVSLKDADGHEVHVSAKSAKQDATEVFREASELFIRLRSTTSDQEQAGR